MANLSTIKKNSLFLLYAKKKMAANNNCRQLEVILVYDGPSATTIRMTGELNNNLHSKVAHIELLEYHVQCDSLSSFPVYGILKLENNSFVMNTNSIGFLNNGSTAPSVRFTDSVLISLLYTNPTNQVAHNNLNTPIIIYHGEPQPLDRISVSLSLPQTGRFILTGYFRFRVTVLDHNSNSLYNTYGTH